MRSASHPLPPSPSSTPLAYLQQHHAVEPPQIDGRVFRPFWRRRTQIDRLLLAGAINWMELRIAVAYRDLHDRAVGSQIRTTRLNSIGGGRGQQAGLHPHEALIAALRRLHDVHDRLDVQDIRILNMVVIEDAKWCEAATQLGVHPKTVKRRAIAALKRLARCGDSRLRTGLVTPL